MTASLMGQSLDDIWTSAWEVCGAPNGEYSNSAPYLGYYQQEFADIRELDVGMIASYGLKRASDAGSAVPVRPP
jgi:hypothetical protein